ncbi:MAG: DsbA family protein [Pseudomonadota bacterium]|nr:DsbA family protein [Pseudomonadota bacterium]
MTFNKLLNFFDKKIISRARNKIIQRFVSENNLMAEREKKEKKRITENRPHEVYYFHQVDDPYSLLILPTLEELKNKYSIKLSCILVGEAPKETIHEPNMYELHCLNDVRNMAYWHGIDNQIEGYPSAETIQDANKILSSCDEKDFVNLAISVSRSIWLKDSDALENYLSVNMKSDGEVRNAIQEGNNIRKESGYYFGSAFHYGGENYWGVDRLNHLEDRLTELGLKKIDSEDYIVKRKEIHLNKDNIDRKLILNFYPSLNSPYTYISFPRVKSLVQKYSLNIVTKPVLPMLMRGMSIPRYKVKYILSDAAREGRKYGIKIKDVYSPLGEPAETAYSLFPKIDELGKGFDYIQGLTKASFHDGINIGDKTFLKDLVNQLDLSWENVSTELNSDIWRTILKDNLEDMYSGNCWGVPSFQLTDEDGKNSFYQWGQDRLWIIENEVIRRLN